MCATTQNYQREQVVDFSHWTNIAGVGYISRWPALKSKQWMVTAPFSWHLWLLILVTMLVICAILRLLNRQSTTFIATKLYEILLNRCKILPLFF